MNSPDEPLRPVEPESCVEREKPSREPRRALTKLPEGGELRTDSTPEHSPPKVRQGTKPGIPGTVDDYTGQTTLFTSLGKVRMLTRNYEQNTPG